MVQTVVSLKPMTYFLTKGNQGFLVEMNQVAITKDVAAVFIKEVVKLHGFPKFIVSDRDRVFINHFLRELFKLAGTTLRYSSSDHPETDGQTEVVNRILETYLHCMAGENPKEWSHWLSWAEYRFNTSFNISAGMTPFKALYGRDTSSIFHMNDTTSAVE